MNLLYYGWHCCNKCKSILAKGYVDNADIFRGRCINGHDVVTIMTTKVRGFVEINEKMFNFLKKICAGL